MTNTDSLEDVLTSLDKQRRVAWAKFYELARLVHAGDSHARDVAAAALRDERPTDLTEFFLGGGSHEIAVGGRLFRQTTKGEYEEVPVAMRLDVEQIREGVSRAREALSAARQVGDS